MFCFGAGRNICVLRNARKLPILFVLRINRRQDILLNSFKTKIKKFSDGKISHIFYCSTHKRLNNLGSFVYL